MGERILIVEDEPDILDLISYNLQQAGYTVLQAGDGERGLQLAAKEVVSLVVLDLMMPGIDGLEVCRLLKQDAGTKDIPVLMLTARTEEVDRIVGFELGADDYLTKPFSPRELILRIRAILRRGRSDEASEQQIIAGSLFIDPNAYMVEVEGQTVDLTATEFKLLITLAQRRGRVQSRDELLNVVLGYEHSGYSRTVDTHVRRLREKLGSASELVETVRGMGYRFCRDGR